MLIRCSILVRWTYNAQSTSVGQWLIHDFGTSKIKESVEETGPLAPGDFLTRFSLTKAQRSPSTFQAPEVQNSTDRTTGRESDMWSFGCMIALALAFALGGPRDATELLNVNYDSTITDRVPNDWFYTKVDGKPVTKEATSRWLNKRSAERPEDRWIVRIIDLVLEMLVIKPTSRLKAEEVQDQLHFICSEESQRMAKVCRWARPPSPPHVDARRVARSKDPDSGLHPVEAHIGYRNSNTPSSWPQRQDYYPTLSSTPGPWQPTSNTSRQSMPYSPIYGSSSPPRGQSTHGQSFPSLSSPHLADNRYRQSPAPPWSPNYSSLGSDIANDPNLSVAPAGRKPSIIRSDTNSVSQVYTPSSGPTVPRSTSMSNRSDESSSLDKAGALVGKRSSSSGNVTFTNLAFPDGSSKSVVCGISNRVAYMSATSVLVHNFRYHNSWVPKKPPKSPDSATFGFYAPRPIECNPGFGWDLISLCGDWLILRANNGADCRILRYHCSRRNLDNVGVALEFWTETPFSTNKYGMPAPDAVNAIAIRVLEIKVNVQGDVIFMLDDGLCLYSASMGLHSLVIEGQLRRACFSCDGSHVFAWSRSSDRTYGYQNRWYIWHINSTATPLLTPTSQWTTAKHPGQGKDTLIFPFPRYFAAFEIPDRLYLIGKDRESPVVQLQSPVDSISAGISYDVTYEPESPDSTSQRLILVQQDSSPRILSLPLLPQVRSSTPSKLQELQLAFDAKTHGVAVTRDEKGTYVVISHPKGVIERRKILI
ncbi:uncharacterized protein LY89DRAFT_505370 [Mollisia scopiformis]|uniref:Protein kinase domain-containing protein n=1 Tax=Mollisia scopiformis TaxID=149040 RepID=A0A194XF42_MOLSC|nr:uncharacterized protein LY89DRAFT_505370 [Mollisia scopiformis]KUJ18810.1 hypothetical protein LY89DRAFT_505370 [Mollisia scopiformis]